MSIPAAFWLALAAAAAPADVHPGLPSAAARRSAPAVAEATRTRIDRQHTILVTNVSPFYAPARLTVRVGETVRWRNGRSSDRHSVRETLHGTFSLEIPPGEEASFRFAHPGEFHYRCRFHPWMHGTVFVEPAPLNIEWRSLSADLRGARLLSAEDGSVVLVGAGNRPVVARGTAAGVIVAGVLDRPILPGVRPGLGRDGALWFAGETPGTLVSFSIATGASSLHRPAAGAGVWTVLATAPDGGVWLHDLASRRIGRFEPTAGTTAWYPAPAVERPLAAMRIGADGLVWLLDQEGRAGHLDPREGRLKMSSEARETGPDLVVGEGVAWMLSPGRRKILRLDRDGLWVELTVPLKTGILRGLAPAAGGVWFTDEGGEIARLVDGRIEEYAVSPLPGRLGDVAGGSGSSLWLLDPAGPRLGHAAAEDRRALR